jgi:hypothetical protein
MLKDINFTLHDLFGYFFPGIFFLVAVLIFFWTVFFPDVPFCQIKFSSEIWIIVIILSYLSGHLAQSIANLLPIFPGPDQFISSVKNNGNQKDQGVEKYVTMAKRKMSAILGIAEKDISNLHLLRFCDAILEQHDLTMEREITRYCRDFYRGLTISLSLCAISLITRLYVKCTYIQLSNDPIIIQPCILKFLIGFTILSVILCYQRFTRFSSYRAQNPIWLFLVLKGVFRYRF